MGSLYGGLLARAGCDVTLVDWWRAHMEAVTTNGSLRLSGITGDEMIPLKAVHAPSEGEALEGESTGDIAIILIDANGTPEAARVAKRLLKPDGFALTLQNGIGNIETLEAELGAGRVVGGLSYHSAAMVAPGHAVHNPPGADLVGGTGWS
jgi:2-dehydropantoate 2-reductase